MLLILNDTLDERTRLFVHARSQLAIRANGFAFPGNGLAQHFVPVLFIGHHTRRPPVRPSARKTQEFGVAAITPNQLAQPAQMQDFILRDARKQFGKVGIFFKPQAVVEDAAVSSLCAPAYTPNSARTSAGLEFCAPTLGQGSINMLCTQLFTVIRLHFVFEQLMHRVINRYIFGCEKKNYKLRSFCRKASGRLDKAG